MTKSGHNSAGETARDVPGAWALGPTGEAAILAAIEPAPTASLPRLPWNHAQQVLAVLDATVVDRPPRDPALGQLGPNVRARIQQALSLAGDDPPQALADLAALAAEFPRVPSVQHALALTHNAMGQVEPAAQLIERIHRRFPDYLPAWCSFVLLCVRQGRLSDVPDAARGRWSLPAFLPGRARFARSHVLAFHAALCEYFLELGDAAAATPYARVLLRTAGHLAVTHQLCARLRQLSRQALRQARRQRERQIVALAG